MDYAALVVALVGIFYMLFVLNFSSVVEVSGFEDLKGLDLNEKVILEGFADGYRKAGSLDLIKVNGIDVVCECSLNYGGKRVAVEGYVDEYNGRRQIVVLRVYLDSLGQPIS